MPFPDWSYLNLVLESRYFKKIKLKIINIIVIIKFFKKILLILKKNNKFDLNSKIIWKIKNTT
jgi:hypothetical protein